MSGSGQGRMVAWGLAFALLALTFWLTVMFIGQGVREGRAILFVLLISSVGITIGALWEVAEWVFDRFASGDVIKGKDDTMIDMIMDTAGAVAAAALALRYRADAAQRAGVPEHVPRDR
ncbi:hypothetical protein [Roseomonas marmotae]|uniref:VanZ family protein n=1 Tax=Roseomonas marmotae TaxID=2768161 RepID=A0ABS3K9G6_9PROT|nr:hypothetical protein [Roseomonas marmotae]MBO1073637.1 hypothetical protein [Roseomonas marmotae]MBO1073667.1 hypothetical protein [Roseomonas marmotae]QTI80185.1 hypothetical protein IAI58_05345 [Roseomonas marmotae]